MYLVSSRASWKKVAELGSLNLFCSIHLSCRANRNEDILIAYKYGIKHWERIFQLTDALKLNINYTELELEWNEYIDSDSGIE